MTGTTPPLLVLAAPGAGGAAVATAIAGALDRPALVWDEVADDGSDARLRTWCRTALWRRDRDWTCPPGAVAPTEDDRMAAGLWHELDAGAVLYDVALPHLLPLLADIVAEVEVVIVVRDPREALPLLLEAVDLPPSHADELVRVASARLLALATALECPVVDLSGSDPIDIAPVLGEETAVAVTPPPVEMVPGAEEDDALEAMRAIAHMSRTCRPVSVGDLLAATTADVGAQALDRYAGPVTAQRRSRLHALAGRLGVHGAIRECTRATGLGAWAADERVSVATAGSLAGLYQAVCVPPTTVQAVLLSDVLSWAKPEELRPALALAMKVVSYGGFVLLGRQSLDDECRVAAGLQTVSDAEVRAVGAELGLVVFPTQDDGDVRLLPFSVHIPVARTIGDLEAALARRTEQRDAAVARYDNLRARRSVRLALRLAGWLSVAVRVVRGLLGRG